jgi:hypothetical protein
MALLLALGGAALLFSLKPKKIEGGAKTNKFDFDKLGRMAYLEKYKTENKHWGQFKLLLTEIQFLSRLKKEDLEDAVVVYAGAADGRHMPILIDLFPEIKALHLWDPRPYFPGLDQVPKIKLFTGLFTEEIARSYSKQKTLFISDIRTVPVIDQIIEDQKMQMEWVLAMQPLWSMLKFRMPYPPGKYEYLDGEIRLQAFSPSFSAETRLISHRPYKLKKWDTAEYEERLSWWNRVARPKKYGVKIKGLEGEDSGDVALASQILTSINIEKIWDQLVNKGSKPIDYLHISKGGD